MVSFILFKNQIDEHEYTEFTEGLGIRTDFTEKLALGFALRPANDLQRNAALNPGLLLGWPWQS